MKQPLLTPAAFTSVNIPGQTNINLHPINPLIIMLPIVPNRRPGRRHIIRRTATGRQIHIPTYSRFHCRNPPEPEKKKKEKEKKRGESARRGGECQARSRVAVPRRGRLVHEPSPKGKLSRFFFSFLWLANHFSFHIFRGFGKIDKKESIKEVDFIGGFLYTKGEKIPPFMWENPLYLAGRKFPKYHFEGKRKEKKLMKVISIEKPASAEKKANVAYKQVVTYDGNGEIVSDVLTRAKSQNGEGFVLSYTEKMCEFLEKHTAGSVVRVFLYIAHHQNYGNDGVFGYRCSHKYLQQVLRLDRKSVYSALTTLKDEFVVNEAKIDGCTELMVNPQFVTIGNDKKARVREWNRRWEEHWKLTNAK